MRPSQKRRPGSVLGLNLADGQLRACRAVRAKGGIEPVKSTVAPLSLDVLHPDAELVGREIRNLLEAAGIRERHCVLALPPRWVMTCQTKVPELSPEDLASFLQLEAEKGFPVDPEQLQITRSFQRTAEGTYVTQLAVRKEQLEQLGTVLKAAGLKPASYALGLPVLPDAIPPAGTGRISVAVEPGGVTLLVAAGGGIAAFRTCEASIDSEAGEKLINGAAVARELRITFEQVPPELRREVRQLFLTGDSTLVRQLAEGLAGWAKASGLAVLRGDLPEKSVGLEMAERLAADRLGPTALEIEFLPPRPGRWALLMARYNSRRLATAGFAGAAVVVLVMLAFGWREFRLWSLRSEWSGMQAEVGALQSVQDRIHEFRPFYDTSFRTLTVLKRVTECFPENGSVTAKTIEIRNSVVSISGTARDNATLLRTLDQLRKAKEVRGLKVEQMRGKQFTFTFRWNATSGT